MFTGFTEHVVTLLAEMTPIFPMGTEADLSQSSHQLMVLAEPSTLALAIVGAGVLALSHRIRRSRRWHAHTSQTKRLKRKSLDVTEQPRRGAA